MKNINKTIFAALLVGLFAFAPSAFAFDYDRHNRQFEEGSRYSYDGPTHYSPSYSYPPVYHYDPMPRYDYKPRYDDYKKPRYDHKPKYDHIFTYHGPDDNYGDYHWYDKHDSYDDYGWNKRDRGDYYHY